MLFGEKYPDPCRMVSIGDFSRELCGGTHLTNTEQVEAFEVVVEESVSTGTRRIEALTGARARQHRDQTHQLLDAVAAKLDCDARYALAATLQLMDEVRRLKKLLASGKAEQHSESFRFSGEGEPTDLDDYDSLYGCLTGPCTLPPCDPALYTGPDCPLADLDDDGDVDLYDFAAFARAFTGE